MKTTSSLARQAIAIFQEQLTSMGYTPQVHFELEGCCVFPHGQQLTQNHLKAVNKHLDQLNVEAELVEEYWHNQWELVSKFEGQSPLKEAENLALALKLLPKFFHQVGATETLIAPVVWSGDTAQLAVGSKNIFNDGQRAVHIPNAIQINISVLDTNGNNLVASKFGEILQACLMRTSLSCCLLYMPEHDAFERLLLKSKYGLADELCSPIDISGGHQGSIALYKQHGKHNQSMGVKTLVVDQYQQALVSEQQWQNTARVEHRLGASSHHYNPFVNVAFALANLIDAIEIYQAGDDRLEDLTQSVARNSLQPLPTKMYHEKSGFDAYTLFKQDSWFATRINKSNELINKNNCHDVDLGKHLQRNILTTFQPRSELALLPSG
ncbi:MAG: hypothetical protein MK214_05110 [Thalassotalea sp.]|nr:hypothetical protein [Thalassotalea sp.]